MWPLFELANQPQTICLWQRHQIWKLALDCRDQQRWAESNNRHVWARWPSESGPPFNLAPTRRRTQRLWRAKSQDRKSFISRFPVKTSSKSSALPIHFLLLLRLGFALFFCLFFLSCHACWFLDQIIAVFSVIHSSCGFLAQGKYTCRMN